MQMTLIASGKMSWTVLRITIPPEPEETKSGGLSLCFHPAPPQIVRRNCLARLPRRATPPRRLPVYYLIPADEQMVYRDCTPYDGVTMTCVAMFFPPSNLKSTVACAPTLNSPSTLVF